MSYAEAVAEKIPDINTPNLAALNFDVLIIGAGISGIGAACHMKMSCPDHSYAVLEGRDAIGGTWDLFRYPGVRSDSDMYTLGYDFRPWMGTKVLADAPAIKQYLTETAEEFDVFDKIHFGVKVKHLSWSSEKSLWTIQTEVNGKPVEYRANYVILGTGYYNYDKGFQPKFPGAETFSGQIIHPQHWPENLNYEGKNVVVIGSGATAVTIVPAMTDKAAKVTMLQRSPSYIATLPAVDKSVLFLRKILPNNWVFNITRRRNLMIHRWLYEASRRWPKFMRNFFIKGVKGALGEHYEDKHFQPRYAPWDERLCAVPDSDLFEAMKAGKAEVVTDEIECFTATGIQLKSGAELPADIIVSATGLNLRLLGGATFDVDGETQSTRDLLTYKAVMIRDAPNLSVLFGYVNWPWTLKVDIAARYSCRLLNHMREKGYKQAVPREADGADSAIQDTSAMAALKAGYVQRAADVLPRQGKEFPWKILNDYHADKKILLKDPIEDGILELK